jgi:hypothetical protein
VKFANWCHEQSSSGPIRPTARVIGLSGNVDLPIGDSDVEALRTLRQALVSAALHVHGFAVAIASACEVGFVDSADKAATVNAQMRSADDAERERIRSEVGAHRGVEIVAEAFWGATAVVFLDDGRRCFDAKILEDNAVREWLRGFWDEVGAVINAGEAADSAKKEEELLALLDSLLAGETLH